jgi:hypothetical protein
MPLLLLTPIPLMPGVNRERMMPDTGRPANNKTGFPFRFHDRQQPRGQSTRPGMVFKLTRILCQKAPEPCHDASLFESQPGGALLCIWKNHHPEALSC